jgi:hypothetical protein
MREMITTMLDLMGLLLLAACAGLAAYAGAAPVGRGWAGAAGCGSAAVVLLAGSWVAGRSGSSPRSAEEDVR